jgi:GTPase SAR1 family protein
MEKKEEVNNNDNIIAHKLVILGDVAVGKSSIAQRFVNGKFIALHEPTIGTKPLHRRIISNKEDKYTKLYNKIRNLGHSRTRKISRLNSHVLQKRSCSHSSFRCIKCFIIR